MRELVIGTRASKLALWQATHVQKLLKDGHGISSRLEKISTRGDEILDRSLMEIGGKGLFLKEIEDALLAKRIDLAVHSMKDVPHTLDERLAIAAILEREDPRDAFVSGKYTALTELPKNSRVGSSSLRRIEQMRALRPDISYEILRGNVDTRLAKLDAGEYDAIILATAGLKRLGLSARISAYLDLVPSAGQGAVGIECRSDDQELLALLGKLNHETTARCVHLERDFLRMIGGDCRSPIGCHVIQSLSDSSMFELQVYYKSNTNLPGRILNKTGIWREAAQTIESAIKECLT